MSPIVRFLNGGVDDLGRTHAEMLAMSDENIEDTHNVIQWLFPLREKSQHSSIAPVLTDEDVAAINSSPKALARILEAFDRYLRFLGLEPTYDANGELTMISRADNAAFRFPEWLTKYNHNYLRITRVLKCLRMFGMHREQELFYRTLSDIYTEAQSVIGPKTFNFWVEAVE